MFDSEQAENAAEINLTPTTTEACHANRPGWRKSLSLLKDLPLIPCGGGPKFKAPLDPKTGKPLAKWQEASFTPEDIKESSDQVVCVGTRAGVDADNLLIIDVDGVSALKYCTDASASLDDVGWIIRRDTAEDRLKAVFRISEEDLQKLETSDGSLLGKAVINTAQAVYSTDATGNRVKDANGKFIIEKEGEQVEIFFNTGQCIVLGQHKASGGNYVWDGSPDAVKPPSEGWWKVIQDALNAKRGEAVKKSKSESAGEVEQSGPGSPCPICGRDTSSACTRFIDGDKERINCYQGSSFSPPTHKTILGKEIPLKAGDRVKSLEGRDFAFNRDDVFIEPIGYFTSFVEHKDSHVIALRKNLATNSQWVEPTAGKLVKSLPDGHNDRGGKTSIDAGDCANLFFEAVQADDNIDVKYNLMSMEVEVNGQQLSSDEQKTLYVSLQQQGYSIGPQPVQDALLVTAQKSQYHPVQDFLNSLDDAPEIDISKLASFLFRPADIAKDQTIYDRMLIKHLVGAIKRAFEPGCQHDQCLILQSPKQGLGKDSFYKALFGDFISKFTNRIADKDGLLVVHSNWIIDMAELDHITSKTHAGHIKTFIDTRTDHYRPPYGAKVQPCDRQCVFVGSTNRSDFLVDETGARRWWILPVEIDAIDIEWVKQNRRAIFKAAFKFYLDGEKNYFDDPKDARLSEELNQDFAEVSVVYDAIEDYFNDTHVGVYPGCPEEPNLKDHIPSKDLTEWCQRSISGESATKLQRMINAEMKKRGFEFKRDGSIKKRPRRWIKTQE